jgi:hypothetical protein
MTAEMKRDDMLLSDTAQAFLQRVLRVYRDYKPLIGALGRWPVVPRPLRDAIAIADYMLDTVAGIGITARFKAGRDL